MTRLAYKEAECRECFRPVLVPYPTYRPKDIEKFSAIICRDCAAELAAILGGAVITAH